MFVSFDEFNVGNIIQFCFVKLTLYCRCRLKVIPFKNSFREVTIEEDSLQDLPRGKPG